MAGIIMPASPPETDFRAFGIAASAFFPGVISDEALFDPEEKRRHFDWSWQAVRCRYRSRHYHPRTAGRARGKPRAASPSPWDDDVPF
jgi:hypothetical protein